MTHPPSIQTNTTDDSSKGGKSFGKGFVSVCSPLSRKSVDKSAKPSSTKPFVSVSSPVSRITVSFSYELKAKCADITRNETYEVVQLSGNVTKCYGCNLV